MKTEKHKELIMMKNQQDNVPCFNSLKNAKCMEMKMKIVILLIVYELSNNYYVNVL